MDTETTEIPCSRGFYEGSPWAGGIRDNGSGNMEKSETKSCTFEGEVYPEGAELCVANCMVCVNGEWEYKIEEEGCA
jgi:hypothetical protein